MSMPRTAVLSMDIEDWYHLDYFERSQCNESYTLLDGIDTYRQLLADERLKSSFFVLGELAGKLNPVLRELAATGHDVSSHGYTHRRPLTLSPEAFRQDIARAKAALESATGCLAEGYRAPCFSLDRERLEIVRQVGHGYDSSRIQFCAHPLYGTIDLSGFIGQAPMIHRQDDFIEFEVSTTRLGSRFIPVSGGGYLRLLPWWAMRYLVARYLQSGFLFVLYIHPFELSPQLDPPLPPGTSGAVRLRFSTGRRGTLRKLRALISMLRRAGYHFETFQSVRARLLGADEEPGR